MARTPRFWTTLLTALAALVTAAPATASAASTTGCDQASSRQVFARWLDPMFYVPVPGGSFESGAPAWTLARGAAVVSGSEPWSVAGAGSRSLRLPQGASATSPVFCAGLAYPTVRYFSRGAGLLGLLNVALVEVLYRDSAGLLRSAPLPNPGLGSAWAPTLPLPTLSGLPLLTGSKISLRITAILGEARVDDVYVDPFSRH
jgi:hypothetical protein